MLMMSLTLVLLELLVVLLMLVPAMVVVLLMLVPAMVVVLLVLMLMLVVCDNDDGDEVVGEETNLSTGENICKEQTKNAYINYI